MPETEKPIQEFCNGESKCKPGDRVELSRVTLPPERVKKLKVQLAEILENWKKNVKSYNPNIEVRLDTARVIIPPNGELWIMADAYFTDTGEKSSTSIKLTIPRWQWDLDNESLEKVDKIFV